MTLVLKYIETEHRSIANRQFPYHLLEHFGRDIPDERVIALSLVRYISIESCQFALMLLLKML